MLCKVAFVIKLMLGTGRLLSGLIKKTSVSGLEFGAPHWSQMLVRPARLYDTSSLEVPSRTLKDHEK